MPQLLFFFAAASVTLSALQVLVAVQASSASSWTACFSWGFSLMAVALMGSAFLAIVTLVTTILTAQLQFAVKQRS